MLKRNRIKYKFDKIIWWFLIHFNIFSTQIDRFYVKKLELNAWKIRQLILAYVIFSLNGKYLINQTEKDYEMFDKKKTAVSLWMWYSDQSSCTASKCVSIEKDVWNEPNTSSSLASECIYGIIMQLILNGGQLLYISSISFSFTLVRVDCAMNYAKLMQPNFGC